jgi:hypothetical protein
MRRAVLLLVLGAGLAYAQSPALPATPPTAAPVTTPVPAATPVPTPPVVHRAQIVYAQGQLQVVADNSSLNQILRDIAQQTGMKITGGVVDQHVFGKYGPGAPAEILATLLDGTGSNMLLREGPTHTPVELILTPRNGGPTPPSPSASGSDDPAPSSNDLSAGQPASPNQPAQPAQQPASPQTTGDPPGLIRTPGMVPIYGPGAANAAPPPANSNPQSPNGVMTPQQIYQQLQQLQPQLPAH